MTGRFQPVQVFEREGHRIAQVRDTKGGRDCFVYKPELHWLHWDREDQKVRPNMLKVVALKMLTEQPAQTSLLDRVETIWNLRDQGLSADDALARVRA